MNNTLDLSKFKQSSIGTHVDSPDSVLKVDMKYSGISWFFITFFGTTRIPKEVTFTCLKTGEVFEHLLDRSLIEYFITFRRK
ncbi:MAG: hypothetical protein N4A33_09015 [Bacteriovoracaceae bacterium]|jgi:hypothetical protein|nr:hypothetical protein [Bacteriovoracaceae bacterium]